MKKFAYFLLLVAIALSSNAQTVGEAFYIYRNDGQFNAFFRDEVDSIAYSNYDADSVYYDDVVTQLVYTQDSLYRIPLAAIDSVGFVKPETIYREGAKPLIGELFDYLIKADSLLLTFNSSMPVNLIPQIGDMIVTTELTDKLPNGFIGRVRFIENGSLGLDVYCDSLAFEETVSKYYGVLEIVSQEGVYARRYMNDKASVETGSKPIRFNFPEITIPISLEGFFTPKDAFGIGPKASWIVCIKPIVTGRVVRVVDDRTHLSYMNLHAVAKVNSNHTVEIAGVLKKDHDNVPALKNFWFHKDIPTPWGIPVYAAFGPLVEASGELALGATVYADFCYTTDVTFYPATIPYYMASMNPVIRALFQKVGASINTVDHDVQVTRVDADWGYFAARGGIKVGGAARLGLSVGNHEVAWLGGEGQLGLRADAEINVDFDGIVNAEESTSFYDALKSNSSITIMPYWGIQLVISGLDDHIQLKVGRDDYTFWGAKWNRGFLPIFSDTKAVSKGTDAEVSANITNDCLIPYTIGFSLFDENCKRVDNPQWNDKKFRLRKEYTLPYMKTFTDLEIDKGYKVYPTFRLLGFNVLASPGAAIDMHFPVTISDFKVTSSQYQQGAFIHEGIAYDYRFDVTVTATLDDDAEGIADWGYVYRDPNGRDAFISLKQFGRSKTDDRWAYFRNDNPSSVCLYGYVKYLGSEKPVYGDITYFDLVYDKEDENDDNEDDGYDDTEIVSYTSCPDSNHPHWIDLGIGTLWRCCNEGASCPEDFGGYYTFGQVSSAPSFEQLNALFNKTHVQYTTLNGVKGRKYTGDNGGTIFLPAGGMRIGENYVGVGSTAHYWSSTSNELNSTIAYEFIFTTGSYPTTGWGGQDVFRGLSVRPVR